MKTFTLLPLRRGSLRAVAVLALCFGASALLAGCSAGDDSPSNLGNTADDLQLDPPAPPPATLEDFSGRWIGQAEDPLAVTPDGEIGSYRFPSGSSAIRLEFFRGQPGTISFGSETPPPPPTNFDVGYPEGVNYFSDGLFYTSVLPPVEGFRYALDAQFGFSPFPVEFVDDVAVADGVLRLFYKQNEVFRDWCSQQLPGGAGMTGYPSCGLGYEGAPGSGFGVGSREDDVCYISDGTIDEQYGPPRETSCGRAYLCGQSIAPICVCNADSCTIDATTSTPGLFLRRVGDELIGTFAKANFYAESGQLTSVGTVRFRRAE